ncbi:rod shape-determining protein MreC [Streptosporangiaceae bacterium NEAU-GS5]|nr:rod shape-determining protein MreC [Streptosporangiaceae bacterium NEAU-GS5]
MKDTRRGRLILGVLLAVALVLITVDHRVGGLGPIRDGAAGMFGTVERASARITAPVGRFFSMLSAAPDSKQRIDALRKENARLRSELISQRLDRTRAAELDRMLGMSGLGGYSVVPAQVVAQRSEPGFEDAIEIDVGARDGVRSEMTVINQDGLVGRVVRVGAATSTVVLISDPASAVGARLEGGNELGVVSGLGENGESGRLIRFRLLDSTAPLQIGHRIVTFGSVNGSPYVAGVPIGIVQRVEATPGELTRTAYARPYVNVTALDVVGVVVAAPVHAPRAPVRPKPVRPQRPAKPTVPIKPQDLQDLAKAARGPAKPPSVPTRTPRPSPRPSHTHAPDEAPDEMARPEKSGGDERA